MKRNLLRVIDANFNRSREGLRVCEDIARFILDSTALTGELKSIRYKISNIMKKYTPQQISLSEYRDVQNDIGRPSKVKTSTKRKDCADIFTANIERVKESIRVLEEFFSLLARDASNELSRLRFKVYDIEKKSLKAIASLRDIR